MNSWGVALSFWLLGPIFSPYSQPHVTLVVFIFAKQFHLLVLLNMTNNSICWILGLQVRNLCYMISRREKLKLSHNKIQEQIFGLQVQLVNQEIAAGN